LLPVSAAQVNRTGPTTRRRVAAAAVAGQQLPDHGQFFSRAADFSANAYSESALKSTKNAILRRTDAAQGSAGLLDPAGTGAGCLAEQHGYRVRNRPGSIISFWGKTMANTSRLRTQRTAGTVAAGFFLKSVAVSLALAAPVQAQDEPMIIEEIIVMATKREQTLQEVPVAVSVVNAETLQKAQVLDIKDLQSIVPSLRVTQLQTTGNTNFIIRGFGNGANNAGIEPSVGVFIDGVYRSRSASALSDLPNLERIEVLRGPQSTLFGKNASAGVINVVTARPDLSGFSGSSSLTLGEFNQVIVKGDVTGPLSDTAAFSLSGSVNNRDGYYKNLVDGVDYGDRNRWGVRGQLLLVPSDNLEFRVIADYDTMDEVCCGVANLFDGPTGNAIRAIGGNLVGNQPFAYENYYDFDPVNKIDNSGISVQFDYDFDAMTLTSISAYRNQSRFENSDVDFTSARLINPNSNDTDIDTLTQEIRLASNGDGDLDWMIGGYYFDEDVKINNVLSYSNDFRNYADALTAGGVSTLEAGLGLPAGTFFAAGQGNVESAGQSDRAYSIFGQIDWHMTDRVTLTLGANYTHDKKDAFVNMTNSDVFSSLDFVQVGFGLIFQQLTGLPPTPQNIQNNPNEAAQAQALSTVQCTPQNAPACNSVLALQPLQFLPPFLGYPNAVESGNSNDSDTTWTARLAFDATDNINLYLGAGTGFKATSWNLSRDSRPFAASLPAINTAGLGLNNLVAGTRFAGPEKATVYEIGMKARFERGAINLAIFDQEIDGFQSNIFTGTGFSLANAGKQSTTGVELETTWVPVDALELTFASTWLDPTYDYFPGASGVGGPVDLSGTEVPGVHKFSMNTSATYSFDVGASMTGFVRADYTYDDKVRLIENVPEDVATRKVSLVNASFGLQWANGFEAMIWGRNITDDQYLLSAFPSVAQNGSFSGYPNEPRTYGITFRVHFE
jgi:outer membrane receptor protein involved in Fe transport